MAAPGAPELPGRRDRARPACGPYLPLRRPPPPALRGLRSTASRSHPYHRQAERQPEALPARADAKVAARRLWAADAGGVHPLRAHRGRPRREHLCPGEAAKPIRGAPPRGVGHGAPPGPHVPRGVAPAAPGAPRALPVLRGAGPHGRGAGPARPAGGCPASRGGGRLPGERRHGGQDERRVASAPATACGSLGRVPEAGSGPDGVGDPQAAAARGP